MSLATFSASSADLATSPFGTPTPYWYDQRHLLFHYSEQHARSSIDVQKGIRGLRVNAFAAKPMDELSVRTVAGGQ